MERYATVRERLGRGEVVILDGGIGSELVRRGVRWRGHGMRTDSDAVRALHEEYLAAGADVIRTNTFQLNHRIYRNVFRDLAHMRHIGAPGLEQRAADLTRRAVALAREARERSGRDAVPIAGVMAPLEHCFRPDLAPSETAAAAEQRELAGLLAEAGADLLLLQAMNTIGEARAAVAAAVATGLPVWAGFGVDAAGRLLSGEPLAEAVAAVTRAGVEAVLVSGAPVDDITAAAGALAGQTRLPVGALAFAGYFDPPSWKFEFHPQFGGTDAWPPARYAEAARAWVAAGARIIGGDGGTDPDHIRALAALRGESR
jgi:S-methylmethionine-dependent homocysteine/selenocysteine methylase